MMNFLKEMQEQGANIPNTMLVIHCKHFEDKAAAIHLVKASKMCPRTQHIKQQRSVITSENG
jgi:hypothetical protein